MPGAGLRGGRVRGDVRGREPHLWHHRIRPDEDDQDGHFFFNHPERGATPLTRRAQPLLLLFRSNPFTAAAARRCGRSRQQGALRACPRRTAAATAARSTRGAPACLRGCGRPPAAAPAPRATSPPRIHEPDGGALRRRWCLLPPPRGRAAGAYQARFFYRGWRQRDGAHGPAAVRARQLLRRGHKVRLPWRVIQQQAAARHRALQRLCYKGHYCPPGSVSPTRRFPAPRVASERPRGSRRWRARAPASVRTSAARAPQTSSRTASLAERRENILLAL